MGLAKKLFERYEWQYFVPHPEWAMYARADRDRAPKWGRWIWYPEGDPAIDAPVARRLLRKTFELAKEEVRPGSTLWISADDRFTAFVNGEQVGVHGGTGTFVAIDVSSKLKPGPNVLAIEAENLPAPVTANPAGLLVALRTRSADGKERWILSDDSWRCTKQPASDPGWTTNGFNDAGWSGAKDLGPYGSKPWGEFRSAAPYGPYTTGTPGGVRIIYVPEPQPVQVMQLERNKHFRACAFDPTTGAMSDFGHVRLDAHFAWKVSKPDRIESDDWVVIVEPMP
jgi:hypothetical protein